jgi:CBS domain containing-hemolysin-like protein
VGDIADEYDVEEDLFITLPDGSLIVDARMSILDLEQQLDISIPEEGDFDTLGGYIFQKAGEIPTRGFVIRQDDFDLEVVRAGERTIEKVKITKKAGS